MQRNTKGLGLTIIDVEKQYGLRIISMCLYSCFCYTACKAHAPYFVVICGLPGCTYLFPHFLINGTTSEKKKKVEDTKYVLIFSATFGWNIYHSNNSARHHDKCTFFLKSTRYSCQILMKLEFSRQIFEKILIYQISWKSVQREPSCFMRMDGQTAGQTEVMKLIVAFCDFAKERKNYLWVTLSLSTR